MVKNQRHVFVEIPVEGDWPSPEDMDARNAVIDELDQLAIGEFTGSGGGLGAMDFSYRVADEQRARQAIEAAMAKHLPNREYTLDVSDEEQRPGETADGVPSSRSYIHNKCGQTTDVDGGDFKNIASPVPGMTRTMCAACGSVFPISEFKWADSDEEIVAYYERYRAQVSPYTRLICSRQLSLATLSLGLLTGSGIGIWSGNSIGLIWGIVIGFVASIVGVIASLIIWDMITSRILNKALGVPDARCLK
jgi:hypothetical protein